MATFDDNALSKLTAKIDKKLLETRKGGNKKPQSSPQSQPNLKRKRQDDKTDQSTKKRNDQPPKKGKQSKRDAEVNKKEPAVAKKSDRAPNVLLDEIRALGGDEQDLELVGDIDSDDETLNDVVGGKKLDKGLQAELAKFAQGLGFEKVQPAEAEEDEEDEEDEEGEDEDDEEDDEWEEASDEEEEAPALVKKNDAPQAALKGKWKTVSKPHRALSSQTSF